MVKPRANLNLMLYIWSHNAN